MLRADGLALDGAVKWAVAETKSRKAEDYWSMHCNGDGKSLVAFGVFDGHNGKDTARRCSETLCQSLVEKAEPFASHSVIDSFWEADADCGQEHCRGGSTATVLLLAPTAENELRSLLAFCGDSAALVVDCNRQRPVYLTPAHTPQAEAQMLLRYAAVRGHIEGGGFDTHKCDTKSHQVREALEGLDDGREVDDAEVALIMRALARGRLIAQTEPRLSSIRRNTLVRQRTADHDESQPWVVSTAKRNTSMGYYDLCMSRSIGDWHGSDLVLPHPELHAFSIPHGAHHRVVIASDGLWDVCTFEQAARLVSRARTARSAAEKLVQHALKEYLQAQGLERAADDTTVVVVELGARRRYANLGRKALLGLNYLGCLARLVCMPRRSPIRVAS